MPTTSFRGNWIIVSNLFLFHHQREHKIFIMENLEDNYSHIKGWGIDADPENEPTYPMKNWTGDDHKRLDYERAPQQPVDVEVLHSNERPSVSRVFGSTFPPS